tara:strand:+ start:237 stop:539 length:303 start_codon:yes stop_codon:yes gene_type:complete
MKTLVNSSIKEALKGAIYWNTGAYYTEKGQRLGAIEIEGLVLMVDIDRGLDYYYECEFSRSAINHAYLNNNNVCVSWDQHDPGFHSQVRFALEDATRENS